MSFRVRFGSPRNNSRASAILGALICFGLSIVGLYVLFGGAGMSSGIPLLPDAINRSIGRVLLIIGILLTGFLGTCAVREAWCLHQERRKR